MADNEFELTMKLTKTTKGTQVYSGEPADGIGTVYITRNCLTKEPPAEIIVTVREKH